MSVTIKLDRPTVMGLIDKDPEFKFELSNAVVSEVIRKVFEKDMARLMQEADPVLFKRAVTAMQENSDLEERMRRALDQQMLVRGPYSHMPKMSPALQQMFNDGVTVVAGQLEAKVATAIDKLVTERAQALVDQKLKDVDLDARVANRVERMLNEEIEKKVREHHEALMRKMKEALA